MLFPDSIHEKLGFIEIKSEIKAECLSEMGRQMVDKMQFISKPELLLKLLGQSSEFVQIIRADLKFPSEHFIDIKSLLERIRVEGTWLAEEDYLRILNALHTTAACLNFFTKNSGQFPQLELLVDRIKFDQNLLKSIERVIDSKGKIKPSCSSELASVLSEITSAESDIRKRLDHFLRLWSAEGYTAEGQLTIREGRMVVPVLAEYKRKVKGIIIDESSTGQTVFMEPTEVLELNNKLRDLEYTKRRIVVKILIELSNEIRPHHEAMLQYHQLLSILDFIRAKARFAIRVNGVFPQIATDEQFEWINAFHPLLFIQFASSQKTLVPLHAKMNPQQRIVLISGPNAGGKSVALKTIGLLQLMLQHGILIPVSADSKMAIFKKILIDIGDDQSIESDLSTYSAHLSHMNFFLQQANAQSLVLIDEFGTGTDPKFGGPIAEAVLELLNEKNVRAVITTHYSNLKNFASRTQGIVNASMLYDVQALQPTYKLEIGQPGSSYAFEIAQKTGLPSKLIQLAKQKVGQQQQKVDDILIDLQREKKAMDDLKSQLNQQQVELQQLLRSNKEQAQELALRKKTLLRESKEEAKKILAESNRLIENTIAEIKQSKADKQETKKIRAKLAQESKLIMDQLEEKSTTQNKPANFKIGDWVKMHDSDIQGRIINLSSTKAELAIGDLRTHVSLQKLSATQAPKIEKSRSSSNLSTSLESYSPQLDLRGKRGDEVMFELEKLIDRSLMMGYHQLRIVHGKGDGILRKLVREYLRNYKEVKSFADEHADMGGAGVTLVELH